MEKMQKYQCILESFRRGKIIDDDVYSIASNTNADDLTSPKNLSIRLKNLKATGLTKEQELRLLATWDMCLAKSCNPNEFEESYQKIRIRENDERPIEIGEPFY
jgi:hypothetical protein